jgi:hypothetical protein
VTTETPDAGGYIFLWRKLLEHEVWKKDTWHLRIWLWLLLNATHRGNVDHRGLAPGVTEVTVTDIVAGVRFKNERDQPQEPSRNKINAVLVWLKENEMVRYRKAQGKATRIEIVNWVTWQNFWDTTTSHTALAFNDDGKDGWEADPEYHANELMELWGRSNLPNSPHWAVQEMAIHNLHHKPPHYSKEQVEQIIKTCKEYAGEGLSWIWKSGPVRLTRAIKSTGQMTAEFVLTYEPLKQKVSNGKGKRKTNGNFQSRVERGFDALDRAIGWTEEDERAEVTAGNRLLALEEGNAETEQ